MRGQLLLGMLVGSGLVAAFGAAALAIFGAGLILAIGARIVRRRATPAASPPRFRDTSITHLPRPAGRPGFRTAGERGGRA